MNPLFPSTSVESVFSIDYLKLKGMGYKAIIFDIDSTLVPHGDDTTNEIDQLFKYLHKLGFKTLLLSNNSEERISTFNRNIKTLFIPMANKPHRANYLKAIRMLNVNYSEVILVGDQLFTDIIGANLCGIKSILVKFLKHPEDIKIGKKRQLERLILKLFALNNKFFNHFPNIEKEYSNKVVEQKKSLSERYPIFYSMAVKKETVKRHIKNYKSNIKFATYKQDKALPNVVHQYSSYLIKEGKDIDPTLQYNKSFNIGLSASKINKVIIRPGETFSFWNLVGKIDKKRGYRDGRVIINNKVQAGLGGGLCNLANTLNLLIMHSPLEVTELHTHSDALSPDHGKRVPFGTGTSISYNYVDYRFENTTNQNVQILIWVENNYLNAELRSEKPFDYKYELSEENHHFTKINGKFYRKSKVYKNTVNPSDNKIIDKQLVYDNKSRVMFDYDLIPKELIK
ncbi:YqeG family HAD IIIA-type phosphatase [Staphylococcus epidermidis]|uniref:YqeG family HAD IIIA-type phosphatase n=1 Tax=Staphylococcus epidermidis TaxID=1282 RepID=UPI000CD3E07D|nr:YqeG family HAD IIIA-type phosphatase [Staphylococcus epidermidis]MBE7346778.1 YqeG family HAD IIIA-type phosphatase [Staphylococcus epidermidis]MBF9307334.1 YqeG family HAD IIIA-type phosphatase [Staphylococcus epidermidis]MCG1164958.1 YqeG family HAD IIIA-type phosphatase [Staphylococcus epidermidis]MCG1718372.1 YqeG family HAD IIIA-type phosphatase [Staphylococcus epidermidis]MCG1893596.1 YqeG family HAD IIIA-type phosphatase [Staphylococcus epidermidis]